VINHSSKYFLAERQTLHQTIGRFVFGLTCGLVTLKVLPMPAAQAAPPSTVMVPVAQNMSGRDIKPHRQGWGIVAARRTCHIHCDARGLFRCDINSERKDPT